MDPFDGAMEHDCLVSDKRSLGNAQKLGGAGSYAAKARSDARAARLRELVTWMYFSRATAFLHVFTFLVAAGILVTTLGLSTTLRNSPRLMCSLEAFVCLSLVVEVLLRTAMSWDYLYSLHGFVDCCVAFTSVGLLFWVSKRNLHGRERDQDIELSQSLVMLRIIIQFARVLLAIEHVRRSEKGESELIGSGSEFDMNFAVLREQALKARHRDDHL